MPNKKRLVRALLCRFSCLRARDLQGTSGGVSYGLAIFCACLIGTCVVRARKRFRSVIFGGLDGQMCLKFFREADMADLQEIIEHYFVGRKSLVTGSVPERLQSAVEEVIWGLDEGTFRVAEKKAGKWVVNEWLKKAVLLSFLLEKNVVIQGGYTNYFDKVPAKFYGHTKSHFFETGSRVVPPAMVRRGSYIASNVVLMPCFVNVGAYVDTGTMVDTWATVGSCAQIGRKVHLSGGVGIGGVLEPLQAQPTIIEDDCFIGARSEIVEGVVVGKGSVISMGVYIGSSTRIYDRDTGQIHYGRVPPGSVVVPGNLPGKDGRYSLYCAVIVKQVDAKTRSKVALTDLLREI